MKKVSRHLNPKIIAIGLGLIYFISLIPLLILAGFNHPSPVDDLPYAIATHLSWQSEGNIFLVLYAAMQTSYDAYFYWQGTFTAVFLMALQPGIFGSGWYVLTTWLTLGMFSISVIYLFWVILVKLLGVDKLFCYSISFMTLFIVVQCMSQRGISEFFFWWNGGIHYIFIYSLGLIYIGMLLAITIESKIAKQIVILIFTSILGILVGGGNLMGALNIVIIAIIIICLVGWQKRWSVLWKTIIPFGFLVIAFIINISSPGNLVRAGGGETLDHVSPMKAIIESLAFTGKELLSISIITLLLITFLVPIFTKAAKQSSFSFPYPLLVFLISYGIISATLTPPIFVSTYYGDGRVYALYFAILILLLVLNVLYLMGWVCKRYFKGSGETNASREFSKNSLLVMAGCFLLIFFIMGLRLMAGNHVFISSSAAMDIVNGKAKAYNDVRNAWERQLSEADIDEQVVLPQITVMPHLFMGIGIDGDDTSPWNMEMARYYRVGSVIIMEND